MLIVQIQNVLPPDEKKQQPLDTKSDIFIRKKYMHKSVLSPVNVRLFSYIS